MVEVWGERRLGFHEAMSGDAIKMGEAIGAQTIDLEWVQARQQLQHSHSCLENSSQKHTTKT